MPSSRPAKRTLPSHTKTSSGSGGGKRRKYPLSSERVGGDEEGGGKRGKGGKGRDDEDEDGDGGKGEEEYWEISRTRRVTLSSFRDQTMISIREFYEKDGVWLPGRKGISLPLEQYAAFLDILPKLNAALEERGEKVPVKTGKGGGDETSGEIQDREVGGEGEDGEEQVEEEVKSEDEAGDDEVKTGGEGREKGSDDEGVEEED